MVSVKTRNRRELSWKDLSKAWSWIFLCVLFLFFSISGNGFLSITNIQNIFADMSFMLLMALGQTFVIILGGLDISVGYTTGMASVIVAQIIIALAPRLPLPLVVVIAFLVGLAVGVLPGLLNGVLITRLSVPPFIVTLGMYGIARGAGFIIENGLPISIPLQDIGRIGNNNLLYIQPTGAITFFQPPQGLTAVQMSNVVGLFTMPLILSLLLVLFCHWLLTRTRFGQHTYAIGGNKEAARRAGIPVARHTVLVYILSSCLAATAGVLYVFRFSSGAAEAGDPLLIDSIAAVAIGGASLFGGEGTIIGTLIGTLIISVIQNGLIILGIDPFWQFIAVGVVIIIAVFVDRMRIRA
uniref:Ribose ABC transporter permease n=1 Tax=Thermosporothrix sp. COM3 TaxID=2490863 RepID=A0A455SNB5_9CHLR|nr:ribose ABC transporter permease [Thermosporothrix sp. COM3]